MRSPLLLGLLLWAAAGCGAKDKVVPVDAPKDFTLSRAMRCTYREGQSLTDHGSRRFVFRQKPNSRPLVWVFSGLYRPAPTWTHGGESGMAAAHVTGEGVSLVIPRANGLQLVTVWGHGASAWTKHDVINGLAGANQFLGSCENIGEEK